jgi:hypothetical protein
MDELPTGNLDDLPVFKLTVDEFKKAMDFAIESGEMDLDSKVILENHYKYLNRDS